jgi:hypothetical protein
LVMQPHALLLRHVIAPIGLGELDHADPVIGSACPVAASSGCAQQLCCFKHDEACR